MPFCPKCGKEIEKAAAFCHSCGANLKGEKKAVAKKSNLDSKTYLLISTAAIGALSLIALFTKDVFGFVLGGALCAALYFLGLRKLDEEDTNTAQLTALIVGIVGGMIGLVALFAGNIIGVLSIVVVIPAFMAWNMLRA